MTFNGLPPEPLISPQALRDRYPLDAAGQARLQGQRDAIRAILDGQDDRLLVIMGPCSIHDVDAAREYGQKLAEAARRHQDELLVVMRVYFEKPRTRHGWKGLIYDPNLDGRFDINQGLNDARALLRDLHQMGLPVATEFLDMVTGHYLIDLISWGAIGARTTESQVHRALASGLPCPVGFKNGTDGNIRIAVDAIRAAADAHVLLIPNGDGQLEAAQTSGNPHAHLILRGGAEPNYGAQSVQAACGQLRHAALPERVIIDFSHGNSRKDHQRQLEVADDVCGQLAAGESRIKGIMAESFLLAGNQPEGPRESLIYGKSITDACLDWASSETLLARLAEAIKTRRRNSL
ncbi:3-deoxy-7-phosphoheptulonate synthase [Gallaecimonas sp. GXIMD4217]|uniref:3-deoxy-7-phosphoheptulonate synthase n=1 Tax=Gallaecimonas sp. GXIMD4217 TaxID=3131927 RepID=UPI00311B089F